MGSGPDETVPDPSEARSDDFVAPGGFPMPERLEVYQLGHLFGSSITAISFFADATQKGEVPDTDTMQSVRTARRDVLRTVDYVLGRYGADIDAVQGLREFLVQLCQEVKEFRWEEAVATYRSAKQDLHF